MSWLASLVGEPEEPPTDEDRAEGDEGGGADAGFWGFASGVAAAASSLAEKVWRRLQETHLPFSKMERLP